MITNKEKMLHMVLDELQDTFDFDKSEYEDFHTALYSNNVVVATVARIIKEYKGTTDETEWKKVYQTIFNYLNDNYIL